MHPGKLLITGGLLLIFFGLVFLFADKIPLLGKLPGDIRVEKENFRFYFPLGTSLLISALATLLLWFFKR